MHFHQLLVPNLYLSKKYEIVIEKKSIVAVFLILFALNINIYNVKNSRDKNICRKFTFQGFWTELRNEFCFLRQSFTKYFET